MQFLFKGKKKTSWQFIATRMYAVLQARGTPVKALITQQCDHKENMAHNIHNTQ